MDVKTIKRHIKLYSNPNSRSNSKYVYPALLEYSSTQFDFVCKGSSNEEYEITVKLNNGVETSCNCPYKRTYTGICKHVIASLKIIIEDYSDEISNLNLENDLFDDVGIEKTTKLKVNQIQLIDGIITPSIIKNCTVPSKYPRYHYNELKIKAASQTEITTQVSGWDTSQQLFKYNPETGILEFDCTCVKTKKVCEHIGTALTEIVSIFGNNLFSENYFEQKTQEAIAAYDFTLDDDYNSIFNFSITAKGFQAKPKVKNMIMDSRDFSKIFEDNENESILHLPTPKTEVSEFGLGVYFEFERKKFQGIILFQAKYNNTKTDFVSSITSINTNNFEDALVVYSSNIEQFLLTKSIQINKSLSKYHASKEIFFFKKSN